MVRKEMFFLGRVALHVTGPVRMGDGKEEDELLQIPPSPYGIDVRIECPQKGVGADQPRFPVEGPDRRLGGDSSFLILVLGNSAFESPLPLRSWTTRIS